MTSSSPMPEATRQARSAQIDVPEYRSLCSLAVIALTLGVLSVVAFAGPLWLVVPAAAVAAAAAALGAIHRSDGHLSGRWLALLGLALAIAFATATQARQLVRDQIYRRETTHVAMIWADLISNSHFDESIEMISPRALAPLQPSTPRGQDPPPPEEIDAYTIDRLGKEPAIQALGACGGRLSWKAFESSPETEHGVTRLACRFAAAVDKSGAPDEFLIQFARSNALEKSGVPWRIDGWRWLNPRPASSAN